ncbi:MAG: energy transducer TonB [Lysobacteraceae bacterium]
MSTMPPQPASRANARGLAWRGPALVAGAIAIGLLLFLLLWWRDRHASAFYLPPVAPQPAAGRVYEPLPAPLPAGEAAGNASGMGREDTAAANAPHPRPPERVPAPERPLAAPPGAPAAAAGAASTPVPLVHPAPRYPAEALRNQESGTVLLRVQVGADGVPTAVEVARSSRSRSLDRAAAEAVRQWRFRPAQRDGQPVPGTVQVPVGFDIGE